MHLTTAAVDDLKMTAQWEVQKAAAGMAAHFKSGDVERPRCGKCSEGTSGQGMRVQVMGPVTRANFFAKLVNSYSHVGTSGDVD